MKKPGKKKTAARMAEVIAVGRCCEGCHVAIEMQTRDPATVLAYGFMEPDAAESIWRDLGEAIVAARKAAAERSGAPFPDYPIGGRA